MSENWFLLYTEVLNAYDLVERGSMICGSEEVEIGESVTFFYKNKPYVGKVVDKSDSYEILNEKLKELGATARIGIKKGKATASEVLGKRMRTQTAKFGVDGPSSSSTTAPCRKKPALSEEDANRKRILELNKKESIKRTNATLMMSLVLNKKQDDSSDPDYNPCKGDGISGSSSDNFLSELTENARKRKLDRVQGIAQIPQISPSKGASKNSVLDLSPSKEVLKNKILDLERKLQFAYDSSDERGNVTKQADKSDNVENSNHEDDLNVSENDFNLKRDASKTSSLMEDDELDGKSKDIKKTGTAHGGDKKVKKSPAASAGGEPISLSDSETYPELDYQLRGAEDVNMVLLHKTIYCNKKELHNALKLSTSVTHCVRRLIGGVFKPSQLSNVTLSGSPYRPGGNKQSVDPLHPVAVQCIVDYANEVGKRSGWKQMKLKNLTHTISVKLNEIKNAVSKGKLSD